MGGLAIERSLAFGLVGWVGGAFVPYHTVGAELADVLQAFPTQVLPEFHGEDVGHFTGLAWGGWVGGWVEEGVTSIYLPWMGWVDGWRGGGGGGSTSFAGILGGVEPDAGLEEEGDLLPARHRQLERVGLLGGRGGGKGWIEGMDGWSKKGTYPVVHVVDIDDLEPQHLGAEVADLWEWGWGGWVGWGGILPRDTFLEGEGRTAARTSGAVNLVLTILVP